MSKSEPKLFIKQPMPSKNEQSVEKQSAFPHANTSNKTQLTQVTDVIKEVMYNSFAQAIIKIFQTSHKLVGVFLAIFVIAMLSLSAYLVISAFLSFFSYEVSSMSRTHFELPAVFPKITFCNNNPFQSEYALEFLLNIIDEHHLDNIFDANQVSDMNATAKAELAENIFEYAIIKMNSHNETVKRRLSHDLEDVLLSCMFNQDECNASNFTWQFDKLLGNCYVFNGQSGESFESFIAGAEYGLQIRFYVNYHENLTVFNSYLGRLGAHIKIENNSYLDNSHSGIDVSHGFKSNIAIERHFKFTLPKPYSNCELHSDSAEFLRDKSLFDRIYHSPYNYEQQLCIGQCMQNIFIECCNCTNLFFVSVYDEYDQCSNHSSVFEPYFEEFFTDSYIDTYCLPRCPLECNRTEYKTSLYFTQLSGDYYLGKLLEHPVLSTDFITRPINLDTARDSFVYVNIYYDSLSYTVTSESPKMDIVSLLASIGGNLSLFLGVSVFSVCEIVEVIIEVTYILRHNKVTKEKENVR